MVSALAPFAIVFGVAATVALLFLSLWDRITARLTPGVEAYRLRLEQAAISIDSERLLLGIVAAGVAAWAILIFLVHLGGILAALALPVCLLVAFRGCSWYIDARIAHRRDAFNNQLEPALRLISNGMRVGLGVRQALVVVTEELEDPARHEFLRVLGQTNIGISLNDAFDSIALRMPSTELSMMVRAIRVQTQSGGNLAKVLDNLANTIKARRRVIRKMRSLTSEGRASALIIALLPVAVAFYIMLVQPHMRDSLLHTAIGHYGLVTVVALEALGIMIINRILKFTI